MRLVDRSLVCLHRSFVTYFVLWWSSGEIENTYVSFIGLICIHIGLFHNFLFLAVMRWGREYVLFVSKSLFYLHRSLLTHLDV